MPYPARLLTLLLAALLFTAGCATAQAVADAPAEAEAPADNDGFVSLFNGTDLTGWSPKFVGHPYGENYLDTFRVVDGCITVSYENYDNFNATFGHLFYESPYSSYILRMEYRFIGDQVEGGAGWAFMNSGVMIHGQRGQDMGLSQNFPDSIEVQLLGQANNEERPRPTANVCSPGTHYYQNGDLVRAHCVSSTSDTLRGDQWVQLEIEVHGYDRIIHRVNGVVVFDYTRPELDNDTPLTGGTISLQSESHPCQFRNIEIRVLEEADAAAE